LPRGEKLVWQIFFLHFISSIFFNRSLLLLAYKKQTLPLVGWSKKYLSVNYYDFLTQTDAVTENPHINIWLLTNIVSPVSKCAKYAEKRFCSPRDGVHWGPEKDTCRQDSSSKWID
jgi:hypothetical protein